MKNYHKTYLHLIFKNNINAIKAKANWPENTSSKILFLFYKWGSDGGGGVCVYLAEGSIALNFTLLMFNSYILTQLLSNKFHTSLYDNKILCFWNY